MVRLEYKGYLASFVHTDEGRYGVIENIYDLVTFEAETLDALTLEFMLAVDDYIKDCKELGKDPTPKDSLSSPC